MHNEINNNTDININIDNIKKESNMQYAKMGTADKKKDKITSILLLIIILTIGLIVRTVIKTDKAFKDAGESTKVIEIQVNESGNIVNEPDLN